MRRVICLQTPPVFWLRGETFLYLFNVHGVNDVRQTEIYTAEPQVHEPSAFKDEMAMES
jgi:hypothetical protein